MSSIKIFISYAPEDEKLLEELVKHLALLNRQGLANTWYNRAIASGLNVREEIEQNLNSAQIILLLLSPDFIASDYYYGVEMEQAIARHKLEKTYVAPVLLRPVYWQALPLLAQLSMLPKGAKPITTYINQDEAMLEVVIGIAKIAKEKILHTLDPSSSHHSPGRPIPIASMYVPSRVGNRGIASFLLNGHEHVLHYTRIDSIKNFLERRNLRDLKKQTILLTYNQEDLVREEVPELAPLKTIVKQHRFQIEGIDCVFTFKMLALTGIMSVRLEVGGITIFSH